MSTIFIMKICADMSLHTGSICARMAKVTKLATFPMNCLLGAGTISIAGLPSLREYGGIAITNILERRLGTFPF